MEFVDKKTFKLLYSPLSEATNEESVPKPVFYDRLKEILTHKGGSSGSNSNSSSSSSSSDDEE